MIRNFAVRGVLGIALLSGLAACGGGGSGGSITSIATGSNSTLTYGYYLDSAGGISLYDPASPGTPLVPGQVAAGTVYNTQPVNGGTYSASNRFVTNVHTRTLVYSAGGKLWKVGIVKTGTTPVPTQVSSEAALVYSGPAANLLCDIQVYPDYANHDNSRVVYTVTAASALCGAGSDQIRSTTLGATSSTGSDAYVHNGAQVVAPIYNVTTGALSGFLLRDGADVVKVAPDFSVPVTVDTAAASVGATATMLKTGKMFLVEDGGSNRIYKLYDPVANTVSTALLTISSANTVYTVSAADSSLYVADATAGVIYRLPTDGSAAVTMASGEPAGAIKSLRLTMNRVVYTWNDGGTYTEIRAVDKTAAGVTPFTLFSVANLDITGNGVYFPDFSRKDGLRFPAPGLFFTVEYSTGNLKEACIMGEADGSTQHCSSTTANEYWTGYNESSIFDFGSTIMSRIYRASDDGANITLTSYSVETGAAVSILSSATILTGTLIKPQVRANNYNATLFIGASPDVWHANTSTAGSLAQISNTTGTTAIGNVSAE